MFNISVLLASKDIILLIIGIHASFFFHFSFTLHFSFTFHFLLIASCKHIYKFWLSNSSISICNVKCIINVMDFFKRECELSNILEEPLELICCYESISIHVNISPQNLSVIWRHEIISHNNLFFSCFFVYNCLFFATCFESSLSWEI